MAVADTDADEVTDPQPLAPARVVDLDLDRPYGDELAWVRHPRKLGYRVAAEPHYLLVYPKLVPLEGYDLTSRRPIGDVRMAHRLYEDPTRIAGVRPYEAGDPLNRVHCRATPPSLRCCRT